MAKLKSDNKQNTAAVCYLAWIRACLSYIRVDVESLE